MEVAMVEGITPILREAMTGTKVKILWDNSSARLKLSLIHIYNVRIKAGTLFKAEVSVTDKENDSLTYVWEVLKEMCIRDSLYWF